MLAKSKQLIGSSVVSGKGCQVKIVRQRGIFSGLFAALTCEDATVGEIPIVLVTYVSSGPCSWPCSNISTL